MVGDGVERAQPRITWRAFVLGLLSCVAVLYFIIQVGQGLRAGGFVKSQYPIVAFMPFVLWIFVNVGLKRVWPSVALRQGELLVLFSMLWVAGTMPQLGWMTYWAAIVAGPSYHATPENQWAEDLFDYLPWHVFTDTSLRITEFFWLGLSEGMDIPWDGWVGVIGQWLGVSMAMLVFGFCLIVVFQRQWVEGEKLVFPLAQMPRDLTQGFDGPGRMPRIFRSYLFWIGFGVVFLVFLYNVVTYFTPGLTTTSIYWERYSLDLGKYHNVTIRVMPLVMAVTYLCPVDILGSLIVFYLIHMFKYGMMRRVGVAIGSAGQELKAWEIVSMEANGALTLVALWSIWIARRHLWQVWRQVREGCGERRMVRRYRLALAGMAGSAFYVVSWGMGLGMSLPVALGAFVALGLAYFVTVKLIAATGFAPLFPRPMKGELFIEDLLGAAHLSPRSLVGYKVFSSAGFFGSGRIQAWTAITHHLRIFSLERQPRWVILVIIAAFPVSFLAAATATIELAYEEGGALYLGRAGHDAFDRAVFLLNNPRMADVGKWGVWLWGFGEAGALALMRTRFHWFPLHPIGLAVQNSLGSRLYWFSLLLVFVVKVVLLRYGGARSYAAGKPFFYGLGIGYVTGVMLSLTVDLIWFPVGHYVHGW